MAQQREWVRWYAGRWERDRFVKKLSLEARAVYHTLLNTQIIDGTIPADRDELIAIIGGKITPETFDRIWNEEGVGQKFEKRTRRWASGGTSPEKGEWIDLTPEELATLHSEGDQLQNPKMEQVRSLCVFVYDSAASRGRAGAETRFSKTITEAVSKLTDDDFAVPNFDWAQVIKDYPAYRKKSEWEDALRTLVGSVLDEETYQRFWAAVRNYKKQVEGTNAKYVTRPKNFVEKWAQFVPANFSMKPKEEPRAEVASTTGRRVLLPGEKPPWEPTAQTTPSQRASDEKFWTPERQERWWNNLPVKDPKDSNV